MNQIPEVDQGYQVLGIMSDEGKIPSSEVMSPTLHSVEAGEDGSEDESENFAEMVKEMKTMRRMMKALKEENENLKQSVHGLTAGSSKDGEKKPRNDPFSTPTKKTPQEKELEEWMENTESMKSPEDFFAKNAQDYEGGRNEQKPPQDAYGQGDEARLVVCLVGLLLYICWFDCYFAVGPGPCESPRHGQSGFDCILCFRF